MKKSILLFVIMVMITSTVANSSQVRLLTLGENYDVVKDENNIWMFPSTLILYPDMMVGEISDGDFNNVGGHWKFGDYVMAAYFNKTDYSMDFTDDINQRIDLFGGSNIGPFAAGARLSFWSEGRRRENSPQRFDDESYDPEYQNSMNFDNSARRIELALGLTAMEDKLDLALTIGMNSWNRERNFVDPSALYAIEPDTNFTAYDQSTSDGGLSISVKGRYFLEYNDKWTLVPHLGFETGKNGKIDQGWYGIYDPINDLYSYDLYTDETGEVKTTALTAGLGTNMKVSEKVVTVTDFGLTFSKWTRTGTYFNPPEYPVGPYNFTNETKPTIIPYFKVGLDAAIRDWVDLRLGAVSRWHSTKDTYHDNANGYLESMTTSGVLTSTYLGASFHWGDLVIDTALRPAFLTNGPQFITGNSTNGWASEVALVYSFGEE